VNLNPQTELSPFPFLTPQIVFLCFFLTFSYFFVGRELQGVGVGHQEVQVLRVFGLEGLGDEARRLPVLAAAHRHAVHLQDHMTHPQLASAVGGASLLERGGGVASGERVRLRWVEVKGWEGEMLRYLEAEGNKEVETHRDKRSKHSEDKR